MGKGNKITDSEWKVMKILWIHGELKASEIIQLLDDSIAWNEKTIRTLINRLVKKEVLGVKKENVNVYYPLVTEEQCAKEVTDSFVEKVYNGSIGLLISNFVKRDNLTNEDINMLRGLLENKEDDK